MAGMFSSSKKDEPARYLAAATEVTCPHCSHTLFRERRAQLNTAAMSLLDLDWANPSATTLICANCSHIEWFLDSPQRVG